MTRDYDVVMPSIKAIALAIGIRRLLSRESIYTIKLVNRGRGVPEALHANLLLVRRASEIMERDGAPCFGGCAVLNLSVGRRRCISCLLRLRAHNRRPCLYARRRAAGQKRIIRPKPPPAPSVRTVARGARIYYVPGVMDGREAVPNDSGERRARPAASDGRPASTKVWGALLNVCSVD